MKAIALHGTGGLDQLKPITLPDPGAPNAGEIRVRLHASSLNFHDLLVVTKRAPGETPLIPMADGAGIIEAVGAGVTEFAVGDHVVSCFFPHWQNGRTTQGNFTQVPGDGFDGYAREVVNTPANWFTHAPQQYTHEEAATLTTAGLTAWRALVVDGRMQAGDTVLVMGTGGVSIFALQLAKAMGAKVIATSSSEEKMARLLALGADHVINYKTTPDWGQAVRTLTHGKGVDIVVEVGGANTLAQSIQACRIDGHIALIGILSGLQGDVPTAHLMRQQQTLKGLIVGSRQHQLDLVNALNVLKVHPIIDKTFALDDVADAFRYQQSAAHFGKICLKY
jgi:NADPH:quinone reductase-like Zn-dependent oxidoreductase